MEGGGVTDGSGQSGLGEGLARIVAQHLREHDPLQPWLTESHWDDSYWDEEARTIARRLEPGMTRDAIEAVVAEVLQPLLGIDHAFETARLGKVASALSHYLDDKT